MRMHLDEDSVRTGSERCAGHRRNLVSYAGTMARVGDYRQVRKLVDSGDGRDVEHVARDRVEGAYAPLAQDHPVVSFGENVFRAQKEIADRRRHSALQQNGLADAADAL